VLINSYVQSLFLTCSLLKKRITVKSLQAGFGQIVGIYQVELILEKAEIFQLKFLNQVKSIHLQECLFQVNSYMVKTWVDYKTV
jgi:hypothetical protein